MISLLIATRNEHKVAEIHAILGPDFRCLSLKDFPGAPEVVEDRDSFVGNATKKAVELAKWLGAQPLETLARLHLNHSGVKAARNSESVFVLADDSGLEVDALNGEPGIHSARFAALDTGVVGNSPSDANNAKLLRLLQSIPSEKRTGRFRCVVALTPVKGPATESASPVCYADEHELSTEVFEGTCEGRIGFELKGQGGFGYDPLFFPMGCTATFAELNEDEKNRLSHRGKALDKLKRRLTTVAGAHRD